MVFHPGRKMRIAPGVLRLRKYSNREEMSSKGMSFSESFLIAC